jgi:hypothetical protein
MNIMLPNYSARISLNYYNEQSSLLSILKQDETHIHIFLLFLQHLKKERR